MIINHNLSAINAQRNFKINSANMDQSMEKLSSGLRIAKAGNDAAGLAVSEKMRSQISGLNQASRNAQDGISFIQTTEGYLSETGDVLQRVRELSIQAANGIYTDQDRMQIQVEVSQLVSEVDRVANHAQFNTLNMLTGRFAKTDDPNKGGITFHVGANVDQNEKVFIGKMTAEALGIATGAGTARELVVKMDTQENANKSIATIDKALEIVNKQRADLGAYQNRFESAIKGIDIGAQNLQAAESQIRDADMAKEMVGFVKNQILTQASSSMLSQANMKTQMVLRVLG